MCYELEWFRRKRATEAERKSEQLKTATERAPEKRPIEAAKPAVPLDRVPECWRGCKSASF